MYFKSFNFENNRLNEGWFSNDLQQNCLPLDINEIKDKKNGRLICINPQSTLSIIQNFLSKNNIQINESFITSIIAGFASLIVGIGGIFLGFFVVISSIVIFAGLPFLIFAISKHKAKYHSLLKQHDQRDFFLIPNDNNNDDPEAVNKINEDNFIKSSVLSINDGEVIYIYNAIRNGEVYDRTKHRAEGNYIIISHDNGKFYSLYSHLYYNSMTVRVGDKVKKGQHIAFIGNTGDSKIPHLHFDIAYTNNNDKAKINKILTNFEPYNYLPVDLSNSDKKYWENLSKKSLTKNTSGILHDSCFLT